MSLKYVQTPTLYLAGAGTIIGATSITLTSITDIYGNVLTMSDFGAKGYITLEPDTSNEEAATFTGITANANSTYTLTGVSTALAKSPYTETSGLIRAHSGGTKLVVTDNVEFWNTFTNKNNDETVDGQWTFTNTPIVPGTVSNASTTVKGVSKTSVAPASATDPIVVGTNDPRVPVGYAVDAVGTDAYAITPTPAEIAYVAGKEYTFQAGTANTGAATLNVSGLGAKTIKKNVSTDLVTGDILVNQIVVCKYDGTNMQLISIPSSIPTTTIYKTGITSKDTSDASTTQNIAHGLGVVPKMVKFDISGSFVGANGLFVNCTGAYDGTNQSAIWQVGGNSSPTFLTGNTTTYTIGISGVTTPADPGSNGQTGVVTWDATNIIITWTKHGSPTIVANILWVAQG